MPVAPEEQCGDIRRSFALQLPWRVGWAIAGRFAQAIWREESPDTSSARAEKGNAPGNARGRLGKHG